MCDKVVCGGGGAGRNGRERDTESKTKNPQKDMRMEEECQGETFDLS